MFAGKSDPCCVMDVVAGHLVWEQVMIGGVQGLGSEVQGLGSEVQGLGSEVQGLGSEVQDLGSEVQGPYLSAVVVRVWAGARG
jgi:hypothetical protein